METDATFGIQNYNDKLPDLQLSIIQIFDNTAISGDILAGE